MSAPVLPARGSILDSIRKSCKDARIAANIQVHPEAIKDFLNSNIFKSSYKKYEVDHGIRMPLQFSSKLEELNLICVLSLLNFAHGYRIPLRKATGRGAYDSIRAFIFGLYLTSSDDRDWLSARGMKDISSTQVADLMQLTNHLHVERPHPSIPGLTVGELGGPLYELVQLVTKTLNETGSILVTSGYTSLGFFVMEALKEGERSGRAQGSGVDPEAVMDQVLRAIPGFRDMGSYDGKPIYVFKKLLFLLHALWLRFNSSEEDVPANDKIPLPDTRGLPVFSDNVLPSMLVHFGILDLRDCVIPALKGAFEDPRVAENLSYVPEAETQGNQAKLDLKEGTPLDEEAAYVLRAAAVDACEAIVAAVRELEDVEEWVRSITLPGLDGYLWSIAKVGRLRGLARFVQRGTVMY